MRPLQFAVAFVLLGIVSSGCQSAGAAAESAVGSEADRVDLLRLDEAVFRSQIVARDSTLFADLALADFRVLTPGGMIEDKHRAIAGIAAWDAADLEVSGAEVVVHGPVALVTARLDIDGEMRPSGAEVR